LKALKAKLKALKRRLLENAEAEEAEALKREIGALEAQKEALDSDQQALKILANSTSYGIFVEMIVAELDVQKGLTCFGPKGEGFPVEVSKVEEPGRYFHPLYQRPRWLTHAGDSRIAAGLIQVGAGDSRHAISGQIARGLFG
jgi:DNA polymerase elongation subunit (family B)